MILKSKHKVFLSLFSYFSNLLDIKRHSFRLSSTRRLLLKFRFINKNIVHLSLTPLKHRITCLHLRLRNHIMVQIVILRRPKIILSFYTSQIVQLWRHFPIRNEIRISFPNFQPTRAASCHIDHMQALFIHSQTILPSNSLY